MPRPELSREEILDRNARFSSLAIERGLLTPEQVLELLADGPGGLVSDLVVEKGWVGRTQVEELLQILHPAEYPPPAPPKPVPAQGAIPPGTLPAESAKGEEGPAPSKTPSESKSGEYLRCPACRVRYQVRVYKPAANYRCPSCKGPLRPLTQTMQVPEPATKSSQSKTAVRIVVKAPSPFKAPIIPKPVRAEPAPAAAPPQAEAAPPPEATRPETVPATSDDAASSVSDTRDPDAAVSATPAEQPAVPSEALPKPGIAETDRPEKREESGSGDSDLAPAAVSEKPAATIPADSNPLPEASSKQPQFEPQGDLPAGATQPEQIEGMARPDSQIVTEKEISTPFDQPPHSPNSESADVLPTSAPPDLPPAAVEANPSPEPLREDVRTDEPGPAGVTGQPPVSPTESTSSALGSPQAGQFAVPATTPGENPPTSEPLSPDASNPQPVLSQTAAEAPIGPQETLTESPLAVAPAEGHEPIVPGGETGPKPESPPCEPGEAGSSPVSQAETQVDRSNESPPAPPSTGSLPDDRAGAQAVSPETPLTPLEPSAETAEAESDDTQAPAERGLDRLQAAKTKTSREASSPRESAGRRPKFRRFLSVFLLLAMVAGAGSYGWTWWRAHSLLKEAERLFEQSDYQQAMEKYQEWIGAGGDRERGEEQIRRCRQELEKKEQRDRLKRVRQLVADARNLLKDAEARIDSVDGKAEHWKPLLEKVDSLAGSALQLQPGHELAAAVQARARSILRKPLASPSGGTAATGRDPEASWLLGRTLLEDWILERDYAFEAAIDRWSRNRSAAAFSSARVMLLRAESVPEARAAAALARGERPEGEEARTQWLAAVWYLERGDAKKAIPLLQNAVRSSSNWRFLATTCRALAQAARWRDVEDAAKAGQTREPGENVFVLYGIVAGMARGQKSGDLSRLRPSHPVEGLVRLRHDAMTGGEGVSGLEELLRDHPDFFPASRDLVRAYLKSARLDSAAGEARRLMESDEEERETLLEVARALAAAGRAEEALPLATEAARRGLPAAMVLGAELLFEQGRIDEAERAVEEAGKKGAQGVDYDWICARLHKSRGRVEAEKALLDRLLAADPSHRAARQRRVALHRAARRWKEMLDDMAALEPLENSKWSYYFERAEGKKEIGDREGCLSDLDRAVELGPDQFEPRFARALMRALLGRLAEAEADAAKAVELDPRNVEALLMLGQIRQKAGDRVGARSAYAQALAVSPEETRARLSLGICLFEEGDWDACAQELSRAIAANDRLAPAYRFRGEAWLKLKRYREALEDLTRASELDPSLRETLRPLIEEARRSLRATED